MKPECNAVVICGDQITECLDLEWAKLVSRETGGLAFDKKDYYSMPDAEPEDGKIINGFRFHFMLAGYHRSFVKMDTKKPAVLDYEKEFSAVVKQSTFGEVYEVPFENLHFLTPENYLGYAVYREFIDYDEGYPFLQYLSNETGLCFGLWSTHNEYANMSRKKELRMINPTEVYKWKMISKNPKDRFELDLRCQAVEPTNKYTRWKSSYDF